MAKKKSIKENMNGCVNVCMQGHGCGGAIYGLGFVGAAIYYVTTATSITAGVIGVLKAIVWPAFLVFAMMKNLGM